MSASCAFSVCALCVSNLFGLTVLTPRSDWVACSLRLSLPDPARRASSLVVVAFQGLTFSSESQSSLGAVTRVLILHSFFVAAIPLAAYCPLVPVDVLERHLGPTWSFRGHSCSSSLAALQT